MAFTFLKHLLPDRSIPLPVCFGPFRGARIHMNPRVSLRKIFGLYEHELNDWLKIALCRVERLLDVGANDGYFTFGCAAAFRRLGKRAEIVAVEAQDQPMAQLRSSVEKQRKTNITFQLVQAYAGRENKPGHLTLDSLGKPGQQTNALVKIDVEGGEIDVVNGGRRWIHPTNCFVIEVHEERFLAELKKTFALEGHNLVQINQRPLPLLGREMREVNNWWLVSDLGKPHPSKKT